MTKLIQDDVYAAKVALNTQMMLEQKEGSIVDGLPMKLAYYYWGVVYFYALKKLFTTKYEMISDKNLVRVLMKDE